MSVQDERMKQVSMNEELTPRVPGFALFISKQEEKQSERKFLMTVDGKKWHFQGSLFKHQNT